MEEKEVINILRHYRHDLVNQLQILQGYLSMNKTDKVKEKLKDYVELLNEERNLVNLNAPKFAITLIQFNSLHTNFRLTYHIHAKSIDLHCMDQKLVNRFKRIVSMLEEIADDLELYELDLQVSEMNSSSGIELHFSIKGSFSEQNDIQDRLKTTDDAFGFFVSNGEINCVSNIPFERGEQGCL